MYSSDNADLQGNQMVEQDIDTSARISFSIVIIPLRELTLVPDAPRQSVRDCADTDSMITAANNKQRENFLYSVISSAPAHGKKIKEADKQTQAHCLFGPFP